ncbi:hypothetical protein CI102_6088 [Trichoderma harzianum]|nr:hypothetical protein CI102_6088 [Trichoderma harzianum]
MITACSYHLSQAHVKIVEMEISISESLKGPSCTMAAILITLPSHPSIKFPSQFPSNSISIYKSQSTSIRPKFHLFLPPNSQPNRLPSPIPIPNPNSIPSIHPDPAQYPIHPLCHGNSSTPLSCWTLSPSHGGLSIEVSVIEMTNQSIIITPNLTELRTHVDVGSSVLKQRRYNTHEDQITNPQVASQACR